MSLTTLPHGIEPEDYERIEAAVMETARGRWFLLEYARRQRAEETARVLAALERLENGLSTLRAGPAPDELELRRRLLALAAAFRRRGVDEALCLEMEALVDATLAPPAGTEHAPAPIAAATLPRIVIEQAPAVEPVEIVETIAATPAGAPAAEIAHAIPEIAAAPLLLLAPPEPEPAIEDAPEAEIRELEALTPDAYLARAIMALSASEAKALGVAAEEMGRRPPLPFFGAARRDATIDFAAGEIAPNFVEAEIAVVEPPLAAVEAEPAGAPAPIARMADAAPEPERSALRFDRVEDISAHTKLAAAPAEPRARLFADPRLAALSRLDDLPFAEKIALFA
jgi:hypothetical protein